MYSNSLLNLIAKEIESLKNQGKYKDESALQSAQSAAVKVGGKDLLMFASNNYLGLADHPDIIKAAKDAMDAYGYGMASVRFIAGTGDIHLALEKKLAGFLGVEDAILVSSCFAANEAFFAAVTSLAAGGQAAVYTDELNHASIIDGLRLMKKETAVKRIYPHRDVAALEKMLQEDAAKNYSVKIIVTDGVFSMEGEVADLPALKHLAEKHEALLFVDDSHGVGVCGQTGKGTPEAAGLHGQIDVLSGTLGKALGGALGGYLAGKKELIDFLRQKARPYLFSNSLPPMIAAGSLKAIELVETNPDLIKKLNDNTAYFREQVVSQGFSILEGSHPIVPVMIGEAKKTQELQKALLKKGLYLVGLWFPVVPEGHSRLRVQISAAHRREDLDRALEILGEAGRELGVIG
jgi:glycine C-acetyltransferase